MRALDTSQHSTLGAIAGLTVLVEEPTSPGEVYRRLLARAFGAIDARAAERSRLIEQERADLEQRGLSWELVDELREDGWQVEEEIVKAAFRALINHAQTTFAAPGGTLKIDEYEFHSAFYLRGEHDRNDLRAVDPVRLWNALCERYGNGRGETDSYGQVARALRSFFHSARDQSVKMVAGCVCLDHRVWIDDFDRKFSKRICLSTSASQAFVQAIPSFAAFALWAAAPDLAEGFRRLAERFSYSPREVNSRERITLSRDAYVITYQSRFEFRFSSHLASQLQLFLSTYAEAE